MSLKQHVFAFEKKYGRSNQVRKFVNHLIGGKSTKWIQDIHMKKAGLRNMLQLKQDQKLTHEILDNILTSTQIGHSFKLFDKTHTLTKLMKKRMVLARTLLRK